MTLTDEQWETALAEAGDNPTVAEVAAVLEDSGAHDTLDSAEAAVEAAIADGPLTETDAGMFGAVELSQRPDETDTDCTPDTPDPDTSGATDSTEPAAADTWSAVDWHTVERGVYPHEWSDRRQWMGHTPGEKQPFSPWGDRDAPADCDEHGTTAAECTCDARWKWGYSGHYTTLDDAREWAEKHPKLAGLTYLLLDDDPHAFVDGDDVRCPETGEIHPQFVEVLEELGVTYADLSVSGSGVHAVYRGDLPKRVKQVQKEIDDSPWGSNDDPPAVEIYDHKHVCVTTGKHIADTPTKLQEWDRDALKSLLDTWGCLPDNPPSVERFNQFNAEDYTPTATTADDVTDEIRDLYAAIDRLDAQRVAYDTICEEWLEPRRTEKRCFRPSWASADYDGTAVYCDSNKFVDTGSRGGYGDPVCMAAIDSSETSIDDKECPDNVKGRVWWQGVEHLRDLGYDLPEYQEEIAPSDRLESTGDEDEDEIREFLAEVIRG